MTTLSSPSVLFAFNFNYFSVLSLFAIIFSDFWWELDEQMFIFYGSNHPFSPRYCVYEYFMGFFFEKVEKFPSRVHLVFLFFINGEYLTLLRSISILSFYFYMEQKYIFNISCRSIFFNLKKKILFFNLKSFSIGNKIMTCYEYVN